MPLPLGEPSFDNHLAAARERGLTPAALVRPGLGVDSARPEDLPLLRAAGAATHRPPLPARAAGHGGHRPMKPPRYEVIGVEGIGEVRPGDDVAALIVDAAARQRTPLVAGDVVVISQKIVSKSEGRLVRLTDVTPTPAALSMAGHLDRDPRLVEVILRESRRIVRMDRGILIAETHHGWVCANAGVDQSNVDRDAVALLPEDPDRSARTVRERLRERAGGDVAVIVADTFGRPWREGLTNIAIGVSGIPPLQI